MAMGDPFDGIEFTPEQQRELQTLRNGFNLLNTLVSDPKTATPMKRLWRQIDPKANLQIPEDDIAEPLLAPVREKMTALETAVDEKGKALDEKLAALEAKTVEREQKDRDAADLADLNKNIEKAVRHYRFTDEGRSALITHMRETNTSDPMTAGAFLVQNMERPAPIAANGLAPEQARRNGAPDVDLFQLATGQDDESMKALHGSPRERDRWMMNEVAKVMAEGQEAA